MAVRNWLLPENIEDILPPQAQRIEGMRAKLLELFRVHGYQLVIPPMLEYLESLLTGTGHDLDLRTFKLVDQLSGRMMGLRADITPQVARIDARLLDRKGVTRLCYAGSVLLTRPRGLDSTREPLQIGAEIYGHAGIESDLEIQALLERARRMLPRYSEIVAALRDLKVLARNGAIPVSIDLADLRGYHYHSGVVFAAYAPGVASAVALGGRYDEVGKAFGRARPATGFSMDLRDLERAAPQAAEGAAIRAPHSGDPGLAAAIRKLRSGGEVVAVELPGHAAARARPDCDRELVKRGGKWLVRKLGKS